MSDEAANPIKHEVERNNEKRLIQVMVLPREPKNSHTRKMASKVKQQRKKRVDRAENEHRRLAFTCITSRGHAGHRRTRTA